MSEYVCLLEWVNSEWTGKGSKEGRKERGLLNVVCLNVECEKTTKKKARAGYKTEGRIEEGWGGQRKGRTKGNDK